MSHLQTTLAEFDKKFVGNEELDLLRPTQPKELRAFITSRYVDLEEKIEHLRTFNGWKEGTDSYIYNQGIHQALDDVLSIIRDNK